MLSIEDRIGISTHFLPSTHGETIYDAIRLVHQAGFSGFEVVPTLDQAQLGYPHNHPKVGIDLFEASDADLDRLKEALAVFKWVTVHSPHLDWNLASANRHLRRLTWDYYDKSIELAIRLRAAAMTFHMGGATWGYIRGEDETHQYHLDFAHHAAELARPHHLPVGYEAGGLEQLKYYCDRIPDWGINLDIGHAHMAAGTDEGYLKFFDAFKGRIAEIHHNGVNQYWGRYMEHQPPHLNNTLDFPTTYQRLRDDGYPGPIVCEIQGQDIPQVIRHCQESKQMICGLWHNTLSMPNRWYEPPL
ncbi:MAG: sugar phosphate isomerase/epimerase [Thermoleophilia bacterium]|nr:sugar phosphate isomerase/epimerase [Thermoleophilia bacterium]